MFPLQHDKRLHFDCHILSIWACFIGIITAFLVTPMSHDFNDMCLFLTRPRLRRPGKQSETLRVVSRRWKSDTTSRTGGMLLRRNTTRKQERRSSTRTFKIWMNVCSNFTISICKGYKNVFSLKRATIVLWCVWISW